MNRLMRSRRGGGEARRARRYIQGRMREWRKEGEKVASIKKGGRAFLSVARGRGE